MEFRSCRLCTDLSTLIQERADMEKSYAKSLKTWSKKWGDLIEKGESAVTFARRSTRLSEVAAAFLLSIVCSAASSALKLILSIRHLQVCLLCGGRLNSNDFIVITVCR